MSLTFKPKIVFTDVGFWFILLAILFLLITKIISLSALDSGIKDHYFSIAHSQIYFAYAIFLIFIGVLYFALNAFGKSLNKRLSLMHLLGSIFIMIVFLLQERIDHNFPRLQDSAPEGSKIHYIFPNENLNLFLTISFMILLAAQFLFLVNIFLSKIRNKK